MSDEAHFESTQLEELLNDAEQQCLTSGGKRRTENKYLTHLFDQEIEVFWQFWCKA
jgi:hypothetical protein